MSPNIAKKDSFTHVISGPDMIYNHTILTGDLRRVECDGCARERRTERAAAPARAAPRPAT